jgi:LysM domain
MVAIHIPRPADEWAPTPEVTPDVVLDRTRVRRPPRRLPDRSTRVRRRRLVVLLAAVALAFAVAGAAQLVSGVAAVEEPPRPESISGGEYVVQPGDTLWSIAARLAPDDDPRAVVDELRAANGGADLQVGDRLDLDVG